MVISARLVGCVGWCWSLFFWDNSIVDTLRISRTDVGDVFLTTFGSQISSNHPFAWSWKAVTNVRCSGLSSRWCRLITGSSWSELLVIPHHSLSLTHIPSHCCWKHRRTPPPWGHFTWCWAIQGTELRIDAMHFDISGHFLNRFTVAKFFRPLRFLDVDLWQWLCACGLLVPPARLEPNNTAEVLLCSALPEPNMGPTLMAPTSITSWLKLL